MENILSSGLNPIPSPKLGRNSGPTEPDYKSEVYEETTGNMVAGAPLPVLDVGGSELQCLQHIIEPKMPKDEEQ